jgi:uncharacterized protein
MNIRYLILVLTTRCNLSCAYCYNGDAAGEDMPPETISLAMSLAASGQGPLHIQLTGGEPALVPGLMEQAAREAGRLNRPVRLAVQTNGVLLTPALITFFKNEKIHLGLSLDGPLEINQELRGGSAELLRSLALLESSGTPFNITTVVTAKNVASLDRLPVILAGFSQARGFGLDLLVNKGRGLAEPAEPEALAVNALKLKDMLAAVNRRRPRPLLWREQELLRNTAGPKAVFCHACRSESLAVHPDGSVFPCGQTLGTPELSLGRLNDLTALKTPLAGLALTGDHCTGCPLKGRCPGECPSRLYYNRAPGRELVCWLYRTLAGD